MRILLIRTSALGDVVHCLPVLTALRRHLPEATLAWVIEESMAPLLSGHEDLDLLIPVRLRPWRKELGKVATYREIRRAVVALRGFRADVALDLMGNHKAGILAGLSGCRRRIGLARPFRREPSSALWINEAVTPLGVHAVERALSVLPALGVPPRPVDFGAAKLFPGAQPPVAVDRPFVLLLPGAGWQNKRLSTRQWGALAHRLWLSKGLESWIPCGPGEETLAQEIVTASHGAGRSLGLVPLPALAALMRQARLVLGGDSGPTHLAHALGAPVLAIHGPTDPQRHGPFEAPERAFYRPLPCSPCYQRFAEPKACLLTLSVAEIAEHAFRQLDT